MELLEITDELVKKVSRLRFSEPVTYVYNPLVYARKPHDAAPTRFGTGSPEALLMGMNPGPWGMAQTGIPFGEVAAVRDWFGIDEAISKPRKEHPKRPVEGLACTRSEVSGARVWNWARDRYGTPERFFKQFFVVNYCPLSFMEASGRNRTPDKLPAEEVAKLYRACDQALIRMVEVLKPRIVIGVGAFAEARARKVLGDEGPEIGRILHPSPASPVANRGWAEQAEAQLTGLGIKLP